MCGIVGYVGNRKGSEIVLAGLKALEYRGYDSAGLALMDEHGQPRLFREIGRVDRLEQLVDAAKLKKSPLAIGHTRWATHGKPSVANAHPHSNSNQNIFVVHNGIIENYAELREWLQQKGYEFSSETDTEVVPHLIDYYYKKTKSFRDAFVQAIAEIRGAYAILAMSAHEPKTLYAARLSSPLVIGVGKDESVIASDPAAILQHTRDVVYVQDNEMAVVIAGRCTITDLKHDKTIQRATEHLDFDVSQTSLDGYPHFMLKEIHEIPAAVRSATLGRIKLSPDTIKLGGLESVAEQLRYIDRIVIVACGTASYAGLFGEYAIEELAGIPVEVQQASEFKYRNEPFSRSTALIAVSQSGETADTIAALKKVENYGCLRLGVVNATGSTIARMTDAGVYCHAGREQAVASTKAFFSQAVILILIGLYLSNGKTELYRPMLQELDALPDKIKHILDNAEEIKKLAEKYKDYDDYFYLGRGYAYPCALEGTLKHKECALVHAEAYPAGEMKHGPLALIDERFPTLVIATDSVLLEKTTSNIQEVRARRGPVIAIATEGNKTISSMVDDVVFVPQSLEQTSPLLATVVMQLFSYYTAVTRGLDVDRPRNLAKSVTVE